MKITGISREEGILIICGWCPIGAHDRRIQETLECTGWRFSHGMCRQCSERVLNGLHRQTAFPFGGLEALISRIETNAAQAAEKRI